MSLFTKCILAPKSPEDGLRISVMPGHTFGNGVTSSLIKIPRECYDNHIPQFFHPPKLPGYYRHLPWEEFVEHYRKALQDPEIARLLKVIAKAAVRAGNITFLCLEKSPNFCQRKLLAEECQKYEPALVVEHR